MIAGDLDQPGAMLIVGFDQFFDFFPQLVADNLREKGISADYVSLDLVSLSKQRFVTARVLADFFERSEFRVSLFEALEDALKRFSPERIGFPAVLGLHNAVSVKDDLEAKLGRPVFEIPTLPPSIPGMRLHAILFKEIQRFGGQVVDGTQVISAEIQDHVIQTVWSEAAARPMPHRARQFVLATGGILGGGIRLEPDGRLREVVMDLGLTGRNGEKDWLTRSFLGSGGHPIFSYGVKVDKDFRPVDESGRLLLRNLYVAGATLAGCDPIHELSLEGIALVSGYLAGRKESIQ
jgi:glycerol-3-phosphate dehydrogenase subunit B